MAYRTSSYKFRPKRSYGRKQYRRKPNNYASIARQAWKMGKVAMSLLNSEKKYFDIGQATVSATTTGAITHISNIARGDSGVDRDGDSVLLKNALLRVTLHNNLSATSPSQVRVMLISTIDDFDGTSPTFATVLQNTGAITNIQSPLNMSNSGKFKVIYDKVHNTDQTVNTVTIDKWFTFPAGIGQGHHIKWDVSNATKSGHLYLMILSNLASNPPTYDFYSRLRFIDN